jgi:hypothetical protein
MNIKNDKNNLDLSEESRGCSIGIDTEKPEWLLSIVPTLSN